jgi:signal transduction histidine kinase
MPSLEVELSEEMVEAHENCGNYKDALTILKHLRILEDSLQRVEQVKEVMNLQTVHELENTNAQLQIANEKTAATKNVRNIVLFVAVILGIMFLILLLQYKRAIKLNNKLKKREEELEQSNNMKDKLFSIIGHDLRGPISNITSMLQLLNGETITPDEKKYLMDGLIIHTKASAETLDKLLFWGQAQLKGISLNQQDFDSENIVRNNLSLIQMQAMQKKIVVTSKVPPGTRIKADPVHFDFVVRNLLSNAVKFTRIGGNVTIGAIEGQERGFVTFYVHDNGVGIAKERLSYIFETFGKSTRGTANEKGTSIGLMLCKEYVAKNGGRIWVQSELGNGATFSFTMLLPDSAKS